VGHQGTTMHMQEGKKEEKKKERLDFQQLGKTPPHS
jgi:hypothetical protein